MQILDSHPVIPVAVIGHADNAVPLAEALLAGGIRIIEVTFRTAAAAESIRRIRAQLPEMLVGAGTVVTPAQAQAAIEAGSQFGLAPGTDVDTINSFKKHGIPFIPGVATPSEVQAAYRAGCERLKFFPADAAGGASYLNAMAAPYRSLGIKFCPTGGVTLNNLKDYLTMDSVFAVGGTWIAKADDVALKKWDVIQQKAEEAASAYR